MKDKTTRKEIWEKKREAGFKEGQKNQMNEGMNDKIHRPLGPGV